MNRLLLALLLCLAGAHASRSQPVPEDPSRPRLMAQFGHLGAIYAAAFSPDGRLVATGGAGTDNAAVLWTTDTGEEVRRFTGHAFPIRGIAFSPTGDTLLTASADFGARLWSVSTGAMLLDLFEHTEKVNAAAYAPGGRLVATGSTDGTALLWDPTAGVVRARLQHGAPVLAVAFSPDGRRVLTGADDRTARIWDAASGQETTRFETEAAVQAVAFQPDGEAALLGLADASARLWGSDENAEPTRLDGHLDGVHAVAFSPDGLTAVTTGGHVDLEGRLWDVATGEERARLAGNFGLVWDAAFSPEGDYLATAAWDNTARLWSTEEGSEARLFQGHTGRLFDVTFSPDGRHLLTGADDSVAVLWSVETSEELQRYEGHRGRVWDVGFSPDGRRVLTGSSDSTAILWAADTGEILRRFAGHTGQVWDATFSSTGDSILTSGTDGTLRLWETDTGAELLVIDTGTQILDSDFGRDGRTILTGSADRSAVLWSAETGEEVRRFEGHGAPVWSVAYAPDGQHVLTGSDDQTLRLWSIETGRQVRGFGATRGRVVSLDFSPDGQTVLAANGTSQLWDVAEGRALCRFISFLDLTWAVIDSDGRYDASHGGEIAGLHWVVDNEPIRLSQFKEQYYEPELLAKYLGRNIEPPRPVASLPQRNVTLFPNVQIIAPPDAASPRLRVRLSNQGGGIGRVAAFVNGKEITSDARPGDSNPDEDQLELDLDLTGNPYLKPGQENEVQVVAFNAEDYLSSRGVRAAYRAPEQEIQPPRLWAVAAGVSDYAGELLDLRFASKDAADFASALRLGAQRLFEPERVHLFLFNDETTPATRANLEAAFDTIAAQARSTDVLVIYLAGHGVSHGEPEGDYYYLTQDAESGDLSDPAARRAALSAPELTELIKRVPAVQQVLILDTCASAKLIQDLSEDADISSSQIRSIEKVKDRTNTFIIAGSAADAVSYEASRYGQGVLTYSLLLGLRGPALRADQFVDVLNLFDFATRQVPELAQGIGGIQQPELAVPYGGSSFDIGHLLEEDRLQIPLVIARPMVLRTGFTPESEPFDVLRLSSRMNEALRLRADDADASPFMFLDNDDAPNAYRLLGRYSATDDSVTVRTFVYQDARQVTAFERTAPRDDLDALTRMILDGLEAYLETTGD